MSVAACTIIARNYLAQARVLIDSFLKCTPDAPFYLYVVDGVPAGLQLQPTVHVLGPDDVPVPAFREMSFRYDVTELCTAVKPSLLQFILFERKEEAIAYFDPDIVIFRDLTEVWDCLATSDIVLIPHLLDPIPLDGLRPDEQSILAAGAYNLGFIAFRASSETERLLLWWEERLQDNCRVDVANGLFVDQKWIDLVPSLFSGTSILRDDTYDVAYWNLHSRSLERSGYDVLVNGRPLAFFHFSGYNPSHPRTLSKHQNRLTVINGSALAYLLDTYAALVFQRGFRVAQEWRYGHSSFDNGVPISTLHRQLYQSLSFTERERFGDPFNVAGSTSFFAWSLTPSPTFNDISPFLDRLLTARPDIRDEIPQPRGRDREQFVRWAMTDGATQMGFDPLFADLAFWSQAGDMTASLVGPDTTERAMLAGVNVTGYLRNESGLGEVTRGFIRALRGNGVPLGMRDLQKLSANRSEDPTIDGIDDEAPYDINLVCVNADQHFVVKSHLGAEFFRNRYNIGVWFWELPSFPREWWDRFDEYDEIWATSSFIASTLTPISPIPIVRIPPVLTSSVVASRDAGRSRLGVEPDEFVYLFTFDFASYFERKNPLGVIEAFRQSYRAGDRARLVIKCVNEHLDQAAFDRMSTLSVDLPVSIHTGYWSADDMRNLSAACDAYVSLHRSEGLGLTIAEAMALGKPVIATGWSGNADFMTATNSFPVAFELVRLERDHGPYLAGSQWAEPDLAEASHFMRLVYEDRDLARARGEAARSDIERDYSVDRVGEIIQERLAVIIGRMRKRASVSPTPHTLSDVVHSNGVVEDAQGVGGVSVDEPGDDGDPGVLSSSQSIGPASLLPSMELARSSHGPLGVLAKRGMDFLLRYHTHYQGEVNLAFSRFMHELDTRQAAHDRDIAELYRRSDLSDPQALRRLSARVEHLNTQARLLEGLSRRIDKMSLERTNEVHGLQDSISAIQREVERLLEVVRSLQSAAQAVGAWQGHAEQHLGALNAQVTTSREAAAALTKALEELAPAVARMEGALAARPYMAQDIFGAQGDLTRPMGFGIDNKDGTSVSESPRAFEDLFRGSPTFIAERQRVYLQFFEGLRRVVDLGSGRGEFLDLLHERGIEAVGVELNEALVAQSRGRGRHVELADAFDYLQRQPVASLDAIFSAQLIEHVPSSRLAEFMRLAYAKLRQNGVLIAETVNPESLAALKTFHVDLTHERPIYPQVLLHLCQQAGFSSGRIFYPLGGGFTQATYSWAGEYALIALR